MTKKLENPKREITFNVTVKVNKNNSFNLFGEPCFLHDECEDPKICFLDYLAMLIDEYALEDTKKLNEGSIKLRQKILKNVKIDYEKIDYSPLYNNKIKVKYIKEPKIYQVEISDDIYDLEGNLKNNHIDICIFEYHKGDYEGHGNALMKKDGLWFRENLGHCSCNGPLDNLVLDEKTGYKSLKELREKCTPDCLEELHNLLYIVKKNKLR